MYTHSSRNWLAVAVALVAAILLLALAYGAIRRSLTPVELVILVIGGIVLATALRHLAFPKVYSLSIDHDAICWRQPGCGEICVRMSDLEQVCLSCPDEPSMVIVLKDGAVVAIPVMCLGDAVGVARFFESHALGFQFENRLGKHVPRW